MGDESMVSGPVVKVEDRRAVTRLWVVLQKAGRVRDEYIRDASMEGRVAKAGVLVRLADEIWALADEVAREAGRERKESDVASALTGGLQP